LQELRGALRCNRQAVPAWLEEMKAGLSVLGQRLAQDAASWQARLDGLERRVDEALRRLEADGPLLPTEVAQEHPWALDALNYLDRRRGAGAPDDCPLPELFTALSRHYPSLSLGTFHDGLRRLHQRQAVRLRPADTPADLAQPEYALLDDARVYYYAGR
jgi:hypothetical protein